MKAKQENIVKERERKLAQKQLEKEREQQIQLEAKQAEKHRQKKQIQALSFDVDGSEEEEEDDEEDRDSDIEEFPVLKKIRKNPDRKGGKENRLREELRQEWVAKQSTLKEEEIDITFSYWDGSGYKKTVRMKKGNSVYRFLQRCLELLREEFSELKTVTADQLMYVKEDLILPHHYTFYDFIVTKARGKSGPLFTFDVHDDIRMMSDASVEKEESHAGKVLLRSWFERNN
ncbi:Protein fam50a [Homalodisca vitripennis]|nr:Protein fam50a [Homalodisca vitripennis]